MAEISAYAKNPFTGRGAWGARFQSGIEGKHPNLRRRIGCSCRGTPNSKEGSFDTSKTDHGANCRWSVSLALQNNEWILHSIRAEHSHELLTISGRNSFSIPFGTTGHPRGVKDNRRNDETRWCCSEDHTSNLKHQCTNDGPSNKLRSCPAPATFLYDANYLTQYGTLHGCAFTLEGSIGLFKKQGERLCVIIDSTFSKNRLGLRLVSFTAITENGHAKVKFCKLFTSKILLKILHQGSYVL